MQLQLRINAFVKLGQFLKQFSNGTFKINHNVEHNDLFFESFKHQLKLAENHNSWFTKENIQFALEGWTQSLTPNQLNTWLQPYPIKHTNPKLVAIIMAGNIPLVGFHDFLSVLITGHHVLVKQSSNDNQLLPFLAKYLEHVEPYFKGKINFTDSTLNQYDAVIATGSNNTTRYFENYFKGKPSIIRNNRNSIAVLTGDETSDTLKCLSEDIFRYYGLGCRNVSKIYVPRGYNFDLFFESMYHWHPLINKAKYANNYDYNKAVYLMSEFDMLDNGFFIIKEDTNNASPIATLFYEYYDDKKLLKHKLASEHEHIQCIVSKGLTDHETPFGATQKPQLWDYADGIDTVEFLLTI